MELLNSFSVIQPSKLLENLVNPSARPQNPLHYYLLIYFLNLQLSEFENLSEEIDPFEDRSYKCLNPKCIYSDLLPVITRILRNTPTGKTDCKCVVTCECGYSYYTIEEMIEPNKVKNKVTIIDYGDLFYGCFTELWNASISINRISVEMKIIPNHVKKIAHQLHLPDRGFENGIDETQHVERIYPTPKPKEAYREEWIANMRKFPDYSYKQLREINQTLYRWLIRHDSQWLCENRPSTMNNNQKKNLPQINWKTRDLELSETVQAAAKIIRTRPSRPVQVTMTEIEREIGKPGIIGQNIHNLPRVQKVLEIVVETREDFALRRIDWAGNSFQKENIRPNRTKFLRRASVDHMRDNQTVMKYADNVYNKLFGSE